MKNISSGFFLQFNDEEFKEVELYLIANRYPIDRDGMKQAFMDFILDEEPDGSNPILDAMEKHPEVISKVGEAAINVVSSLFKKKKPGS